MFRYHEEHGNQKRFYEGKKPESEPEIKWHFLINFHGIDHDGNSQTLLQTSSSTSIEHKAGGRDDPNEPNFTCSRSEHVLGALH